MFFIIFIRKRIYIFILLEEHFGLQDVNIHSKKYSYYKNYNINY